MAAVEDGCVDRVRGHGGRRSGEPAEVFLPDHVAGVLVDRDYRQNDLRNGASAAMRMRSATVKICSSCLRLLSGDLCK